MPATARLALLLALALPVTCARAASTVVPWRPTNISSEWFESHGAFDPRNGDFYFVRSKRDFSDWRLMVSHCGKTGWSTPLDVDFAGGGVEADPFFSADGKQMYFISTRATDGVKHKDLDIWRVDRGADGKWGEPLRLPEPVNSRGNEWFPRPAVDGWLYFGSSRPGGVGKTDIWRARKDAQGRWRVENLGSSINTAADEYEALLSPDGQRMVVNATDGFYQSRRREGGWTPKTKLPAPITVNGSEIGALFSPSGKSMLFARDTKGPLSGEFLVWHLQGAEPWPPLCSGTDAPSVAPGVRTK